MTTDFIIAMNARDGTRETETVSSMSRALTLIEEMAGDRSELVYVISVDHMDGGRALNDVTDNVVEQLSARETSKLIERFHRGEHGFFSLNGYLEAADRMWPEGRSR